MAPALMAHPDLRNPFDKVELKSGQAATVLCNDKTIELQKTLNEPGLWASPEDLTRINGFTLKPEGACLGELCIPLKDGSDLLTTIAGEQWINIAAFADLMDQPYVVDTETNTWSLGDMPSKRQSMFSDARAPDFEVIDRQGKVVRMSDFKGKKALIVTWSSW